MTHAVKSDDLVRRIAVWFLGSLMERPSVKSLGLTLDEASAQAFVEGDKHQDIVLALAGQGWCYSKHVNADTTILRKGDTGGVIVTYADNRTTLKVIYEQT